MPLQLLSTASSGIVLCSFGTVWYPSEAGVRTILAALRRLAPLRVVLKAPPANQKQQQFNEPSWAEEMLAQAPNILVLNWLPQVTTARCPANDDLAPQSQSSTQIHGPIHLWRDGLKPWVSSGLSLKRWSHQRSDETQGKRPAAQFLKSNRGVRSIDFANSHNAFLSSVVSLFDSNWSLSPFVRVASSE
jgi:hypothetical protein